MMDSTSGGVPAMPAESSYSRSHSHSRPSSNSYRASSVLAVIAALLSSMACAASPTSAARRASGGFSVLALGELLGPQRYLDALVWGHGLVHLAILAIGRFAFTGRRAP